MSCKDCVKTDFKNWLDSLLFVSIVASLPVSIIGLIVVWVNSFDDDDGWGHITEHSMNWWLFITFGVLLILGVATLLTAIFDKEEIQDK